MSILGTIRSYFMPAQPVTPNQVTLGEISVADTSRLFGEGATTIYNPDVLISRRGLTTLDEMRRDDQIKAAMQFKKSSVLASGWTIEAKDQPEDWEPKVFIEKMLAGMVGTFEERLFEVMTALDYGFSISEKVYAERDGYIQLESLKTRAPHEWMFTVLPNGDLVGAKQGGREFSLADMAKFVVFSYDEEFSNPYGRSDLVAAYRDWWTKKNAYQWMAMLLERMGIPPVVAMYNPNDYTGATTSTSQLKKIFTRMQGSTVALIPRASKESLELWTPELAGQVSTVFMPALEFCNKGIARALLMPGLLGMTDDQATGSLARSKVHFDVFMLVVSRLQRQLQEAVVQEHIIDPLLALNFAGLEPGAVSFKFLPFSEDAKGELLDKWATLVGAQVVQRQESDEAHVREMLGFPEPNEEDRIESEESEDEPTSLEDEPEEEPEDEPAQKKSSYSFDESHQLELEAIYSIEDVSSEMDALEVDAAELLVDALQETRDALRTLVLKDFVGKSATWVNRLDLRRFGAAQEALGEMLRSAYTTGRMRARKHVEQLAAEEYATRKALTTMPRASIKYFRERELYISGLLKDDLTKQAKAILLQAIKAPEPIEKTVSKLSAMFEPYVGSADWTIADWQQSRPHRLATIVRTNVTDAYNHGALVEFRSPELHDVVKAIRYSAIMDDVTTQVCWHLNGTLFRVDDPRLDRVLPPNHFNCRSIIEPIINGRQIKPELFITEEKMREVSTLTPSGFGGTK